MFRKVLFPALIAIVAVGVSSAQQPTQLPANLAPSNQDVNIDTYIDLLRSDIRSQKVKVLTAVMQFTPDEAAAFWPIYQGYDTELTRLGDQRVAVIKEYADSYGSMTDANADELVAKFLSVRAQRDEALRKCYQQVREKMGGVAAARFLQVESQLLLLIDLQVASMLPAVE